MLIGLHNIILKQMSYVILTDSRKKQGEKVALVDRAKHKDIWWTEFIEKAMVFETKSAADIQCSKIKFNNPQVYTYDNAKIRLGQVLVKSNQSWLSRALDRKMQEWHDDDWYEGIND